MVLGITGPIQVLLPRLDAICAKISFINQKLTRITRLFPTLWRLTLALSLLTQSMITER